MKYINKLTQEQKDMIPVWRDKWIAKGLQTGETDWETFEKYIPVCYEKANLKWHNNIVKVSSPLVGAIAAMVANAILKSNAVAAAAVRNTVHCTVIDTFHVVRDVSDAVDGTVRDVSDAVDGTVRDAVAAAVGNAVDDAVGGTVRGAVGNAVRGAVGAAVDNAVDDAVGGAVGGTVGDAVGAAVDNAVDDAVGDAVRGAVGAAVDDAVDDAVGDVVGNAVGNAVDDAVDGTVRGAVRGVVEMLKKHKIKNASWHHWLGGQFSVGNWWGSPSFVSFFREVCGLELDKDIEKRADAYQKICESVNYMWLNTHFTMVCARPSEIHRDDQGRLHNESGLAIKYPDGWGLYCINGVEVDEQIVLRPETITVKQIQEQSNQEQRRIMIERHGVDKYLQAINATIVDVDLRGVVGGGARALMKDDKGECWFIGTDGSTNRVYNMYVGKGFTTCKAAHEALAGFSEELIKAEG